jgi:preprotein translocase subunit SecE
VARNRKRAKQRARRPAGQTGARRGTATAGLDAPDPIEHASPDVELAEAQLALGRPEPVEEPADETGAVSDGSGDAEAVTDDGAETVADADDGAEAVADADGGAEAVADADDGTEAEVFEDASDFDETEEESEALTDQEFGAAPEIPGVLPERVHVEGDRGRAAPATAVPAERRVAAGNRLINFLQGSWRELQRVQWPDRRQVMQATGVVIGFVIVAGVFLGVADFLATKIMNYILTGHFK